MMDTSRVTRVEVIDHTGRILTRYSIHAEAQLQDDGRTLKIFLTESGSGTVRDDAPCEHCGLCPEEHNRLGECW